MRGEEVVNETLQLGADHCFVFYLPRLEVQLDKRRGGRPVEMNLSTPISATSVLDNERRSPLTGGQLQLAGHAHTHTHRACYLLIVYVVLTLLSTVRTDEDPDEAIGRLCNSRTTALTTKTKKCTDVRLRHPTSAIARPPNKI